MPFPLESPAARTRATRRSLPLGPAPAKVGRCLGACARGGAPFFWDPKFHARATSFGKTDRNRLLARASAMLAFTDVIHFFSYKFSGLCAGGFAFACIFSGAFQRTFFRHEMTLAAQE